MNYTQKESEMQQKNIYFVYFISNANTKMKNNQIKCEKYHFN